MMTIYPVTPVITPAVPNGRAPGGKGSGGWEEGRY